MPSLLWLHYHGLLIISRTVNYHNLKLLLHEFADNVPPSQDTLHESKTLSALFTAVALTPDTWAGIPFTSNQRMRNHQYPGLNQIGFLGGEKEWWDFPRITEELLPSQGLKGK